MEALAVSNDLLLASLAHPSGTSSCPQPSGASRVHTGTVEEDRREEDRRAVDRTGRRHRTPRLRGRRHRHRPGIGRRPHGGTRRLSAVRTRLRRRLGARLRRDRAPAHGRRGRLLRRVRGSRGQLRVQGRARRRLGRGVRTRRRRREHPSRGGRSHDSALHLRRHPQAGGTRGDRAPRRLHRSRRRSDREPPPVRQEPASSSTSS